MAASPPHALSGAACKARPNEKLNSQGSIYVLGGAVDGVQVLGRLVVALSAAQKHDARHGGRHGAHQAVEGARGDIVRVGALGGVRAGDDHVRLEQRAGQVDALAGEFVVGAVQRASA